MTSAPAIPGAINVTSDSLEGDEIIEIGTAGPESAQTTVSAIAAHQQLVMQTTSDFEASIIERTVKIVFRESYSIDVPDGGTIWQRVTSEPSHPGKIRSLDRFLPDGTRSSANGGWWELKATTVRPANFGGRWYVYDQATWTAVGKTAATTAIADAVTYMAATGAVIDHPGAIYVSMATVVLVPTVVNYIGTLYLDFSLATLTLIEGAPTAISLQGVAPTLIGSLTSDIRLPTNPFISGSSSIKNVFALTALTGVSVNDIAILTSDYNIASGNVTSYSTQPLRVMAIDSGANTLTTYDEPWNSYLVADNARMLRFDTRTSINISGELRLYGGGFRAQGNNGQMGVFCIYCYNNRYGRITTFNMQYGAYSEWNSINTFGRLIDYTGCNAPASNPTTPGSNTAYPVGCAGSYDAYYGDVIANRARHGFTNSVSPANYGRWCGNNQRVGKMRLKEMFAGGFDGHPGVGMTYCESLEIEYTPGQADAGSSQVCLSQGAGFQIGMIRVNGRVPTRGASFESYGWRLMTFADPTDPAGIPVFNFTPSAWIGSLVMDAGCSGAVAQNTNLTNQSGYVSPQRTYLQIDNINAKGSSGVLAQGTQGGSDIVINGGRITSSADILSANTYSTSTLRTVTNAADNGSGLIRLTVSSTGMITGGTATVAAVGGVPNATGTWVVTVISSTSNSTTFDLDGSTWGGLFTTGGTALTANNMRAVTGAANNGAGLIRLTVASTLGMYTGNTVAVQNVSGLPNATGSWTITVISATQFDLVGSTWAGVYVTGAADNGAGLIRVTVASTAGMVTGDSVTVANVAGVPNATGTWTITVISATTFDLQGSTWAGSFVLGGWASVAKNVFSVIGAANSGGLIRIEVTSTAGLYTGDTVHIADVGGVPNATGSWVITVLGSVTFTLQGSTFAGAYTSGGTFFVTKQMPCNIRTNNTDLLYLGTSSAGVNADVNIPTWSTAAGSIIASNGTYRSRRGQTVSANNILVRLRDMAEVAVDANLVPTGVACTHTIANGGQVHAMNAFGYSNTSSGSVTQLVSKAEPVTLDQPAGAITMNAANLGAGTSVSFALTNAYVAANDYLNIQHVSGGTAGAYLVTAVCAAGTATVTVRNITGGALAEAIVLRYALIKENILS